MTSICMISEDFIPAKTGVGIHLQCIIKELVKRGFSVCVITTRRDDQAAFEIWNGVKIYRTTSVKILGFYQAFTSSAYIRNILRENAVDIVHCHYLGLLLIQAIKATKSLRVKRIYTYHMTIDHLTGRSLMKPFKNFLFKLHVTYCNRFDLILVLSRNLVDGLNKIGIKKPAAYLSNPVMFEQNEFIHKPNPKTNQKQFIVFYAGRLSIEKNVAYLLEGFAKFALTTADSQLLIAGEGYLRSDLEKKCEELKISDRVRFLGFVDHDNLPEYYALADIFVLPSLVETQGLVAMEAMFYSTPIIVTNRIVTADELVDREKNGYIVDADSPDDLANKLLTIYENTNLRESMGRQSRLKAENYRPEKVVDDLTRYYSSVAIR